MFTKLKRAVCAVCAAVVMAAVSVSAAADYTYSFDDSKLCDEINADTSEINGTEGTFTTKFSDSTGNDFLSLRFRLFNEFADLEFWNSDDVSVSVDVRLDTKGKDVIGCMPAFTTNWKWIDPSDYTQLKYNEWITITETGKHFYDGFAGKKPAYILFQVRTNWSAIAQGDVTISVRNFRINGGSAGVIEPEQTTTAATTTETTTTAATTSAPEDTTAVQPTEESVIKTEEPVDASSENADNATSEAVQTTEQETGEAAVTTATTEITTPPESSAPSETTTINIPEMEGEQPQDYSEYYKQESPMMMILIIVGVAVLISAGAVVGYLIYRKKKYY